MLVKVSLFNLQGARSIRGTGVILALTRPFVNTFFKLFDFSTICLLGCAKQTGGEGAKHPPHRAFALLSVEAAAKQLAQHRKERAAIKIAAVKHGVKSSSILECASIKTGGILPFLPPDCKCNDCQRAQSALSLAS